MGDKSFFVGIGGGTCAGKTSVARGIGERLDEYTTILAQDNYYRDRSELSYEERTEINYDHPDAFDWDLMYEHVESLLNGESIGMPVYDFKNHCRSSETVLKTPSDTLILEGIFALYDEVLRDMMDLKIYVDTDADERVLRRISRDTVDRGRSIESVVDQYLSTVKPMHEKFVEPSKKYGDIIIPKGGKNEVALDMVVETIKRESESYC